MPDDNGNAAVYFVDRHATGSIAGKLAFVEANGRQHTLIYAGLAHIASTIGVDWVATRDSMRSARRYHVETW